MGLEYKAYLRLEIEKCRGMSDDQAFLYFTSILGESELEYGEETLDGYTFESGYKVVSDKEGKWGVDYEIWCDKDLEIEFSLSVQNITIIASEMAFNFDENINKVKLICTTIHGGQEEIEF